MACIVYSLYPMYNTNHVICVFILWIKSTANKTQNFSAFEKDFWILLEDLNRHNIMCDLIKFNICIIPVFPIQNNKMTYILNLPIKVWILKVSQIPRKLSQVPAKGSHSIDFYKIPRKSRKFLNFIFQISQIKTELTEFKID